MTPEQKAGERIDAKLAQAGWAVQDFADMDISVGRGVAMREFPLKTVAADYLLYADGKAIGVVEAKPEGHTLTGVVKQSAKYSTGRVRHGGPDRPPGLCGSRHGFMRPLQPRRSRSFHRSRHSVAATKPSARRNTVPASIVPNRVSSARCGTWRC